MDLMCISTIHTRFASDNVVGEIRSISYRISLKFSDYITWRQTDATLYLNTEIFVSVLTCRQCQHVNGDRSNEEESRAYGQRISLRFYFTLINNNNIIRRNENVVLESTFLFSVGLIVANWCTNDHFFCDRLEILNFQLCTWCAFDFRASSSMGCLSM